VQGSVSERGQATTVDAPHLPFPVPVGSAQLGVSCYSTGDSSAAREVRRGRGARLEAATQKLSGKTHGIGGISSGIRKPIGCAGDGGHSN
jgi:hypothetical protein